MPHQFLILKIFQNANVFYLWAFFGLSGML